MDSAMYEFEDTNWNLTSNELCELRPNQASQQQSWFFYQDLTVYYDNEEKINRFEHIRCGMEQSGVIERNVDDPTKFEGLWDDHYTWGYKVQILNVSENRLTLGFDDELWTVFYSKE
ncbi:MAG: hypothetical protein U5K27_04745 [Desulfotignum sp.]|nr:hypothetical protein [Desulfotignum sp.]